MKIATKKVGKARLLRLAAFLRTVPRRRFDYTSWVGNNWQGAPDLSCGTTACALGWATTMPLFRRLGLRMGRKYGRSRPVLLFHPRASLSSLGQELFGITWREMEYLFIPKMDEWGATPKQVARKIERFVKMRIGVTT